MGFLPQGGAGINTDTILASKHEMDVKMAKTGKTQIEVETRYNQEFSDENAFSETDVRQASKVKFPLDSTLFMIFVAIL